MNLKLLGLILLTPILYFAFKNSDSSEIKLANKPASAAKLVLEPLVKNLISPVSLAHAGDERLFIAEQTGLIKIIKNNQVVSEPFLDITFEVEHGKGYSEKGLLGLTFHPDFKKNGRFFVYYSTHYSAQGYDHKSVLSEFKVSPDNPDKASPEEKVILEILEPESNHNGGQLAFGPDGFLYVGVGDGGGSGDKHGKNGNGQDVSNLLGKIIRLDVNGKLRYKIPTDNPFFNTPGKRGEIWAYGLRNPWRFSFDKKTGELYCGDVGQDAWEEIDLIKKGGNYGWRAMEANHVYDKNMGRSGMIAPIHEYPHKEGISVIGGYVYRGKTYPSLEGKYIYGDWNGKIWTLEKKSDKWVNTFISKENYLINSFGEDVNGELYVLGQTESGFEKATGVVYKITATP